LVQQVIDLIIRTVYVLLANQSCLFTQIEFMCTRGDLLSPYR